MACSAFTCSLPSNSFWIFFIICHHSVIFPQKLRTSFLCQKLSRKNLCNVFPPSNGGFCATQLCRWPITINLLPPHPTTHPSQPEHWFAFPDTLIQFRLKFLRCISSVFGPLTSMNSFRGPLQALTSEEQDALWARWPEVTTCSKVWADSS